MVGDSRLHSRDRLAEAHVLALRHLQDGGASGQFNCAEGRGAFGVDAGSKEQRFRRFRRWEKPADSMAGHTITPAGAHSEIADPPIEFGDADQSAHRRTLSAVSGNCNCGMPRRFVSRQIDIEGKVKSSGTGPRRPVPEGRRGPD